MNSHCVVALSLGAMIAGSAAAATTAVPDQLTLADLNSPIARHALKMVDAGRSTFRYDTFGDEDFWSGALQLDRVIAGSANGGIGGGVSPKTALSVGLKVDAQALPPSLVAAIKAGQVNLDDPATTIALLRLDAVVGVKGTFDASGNMRAIGITCAACHSTVDDSFAPGIGKRLDGWPNRDLNVGAIIALSPDLSKVDAVLGVSDATLRTVLASWGPGRFDAAVFLDGKAFRPDGKTGATLMPAAFGLAGVNLHTYTGWGSVPYWNAFVAINEMHGKGNFFDPRLDNATQFPVAARTQAGHITSSIADDRVTSKLGVLQFYQLAIPTPKPPIGSFNLTAAKRGQAVFDGQAHCSACHVPPLFTEPGWNMHTGAEIGIDDFQANRSPDRRYRTTPLNGLFTRQKHGFYHDGRFATYMDVVNHYNKAFKLQLTDKQKSDLVEYLKSL